MALKQHIVIIGPAYPLRGGLASFNERLASEFQKQGFNVSVYTFSLQYPGFLFPGTTQYSSEPAPRNLKIYPVINSVNPLNWLRVGKALKLLKPDTILVRYWLPFMAPCLGSILRIVKKNRHTKIVCLADNIIPHENRPADKAFTAYFLKPVDAFITMSLKVMEDLKRFATAKPVVQIAHPLYDNFGERLSKDIARTKLGIGSNVSIILFFGFIRRYKGLDILLEAFRLFLDTSTSGKPENVQLLIAGEFYEDRKPYDDLIKQLKLADNLILKTEFIPDSDVKYFLSAADVIVQPYRHATQSGVTPLAYQFEVPMIVTNVGGLPMLVPQNVGIIAEPNAISIAKKIGEFFSLGAESFAGALKEEKKKYNWASLSDKVMELAASIPTGKDKLFEASKT